MKALFRQDGEGFMPPASNPALQAVLASHPALGFLEACGVGDAREIARQLKRDRKLATTWTEFGWSALHLAAFSGSPDAVRLVLDHGGDVHARARSKFKNTPLQAALLAGQLATARLLLERGADPMVRQAHGFTALHSAALHGRRDLVDLLLDAGAELGARADDGRTALTEALRGKHAELAAYLRSRGARGAEITADLLAPRSTDAARRRRSSPRSAPWATSRAPCCVRRPHRAGAARAAGRRRGAHDRRARRAFVTLRHPFHSAFVLTCR